MVEARGFEPLTLRLPGACQLCPCVHGTTLILRVNASVTVLYTQCGGLLILAHACPFTVVFGVGMAHIWPMECMTSPCLCRGHSSPTIATRYQ